MSMRRRQIADAAGQAAMTGGVAPADHGNGHDYRDCMRVVLAEDSFIARTGVAAALELAGVELVEIAESYDGLLAAVESSRPDVVVTDIRMPPSQTDEGIRAARHIRGEYPDIGVVVLSQHLEADFVLDLFAEGADGLAYLLKERVGDVRQLEEAIGRVSDGGSMLDPQVVEALVGERAKRSTDKLGRLSEREVEVLSEVAEGKSNTAIAATLHLSEGSVEKNIRSIFTKLDLLPEPETNRRVKAVLKFLEEQR